MAEHNKSKGKMVIISGPSGVGKSTICREVAGCLDNVGISVSVTTRPKTDNEIDGEDYRFITRDEFLKLIKEDKLLEYAEVFGNLYGTPREQLERLLEQGKTVILEIDVQGGIQAKRAYPDAEMIFILPPTQKELSHRINSRGRDDMDAAEQRLDEADDEIAMGWQHYNRMVINDNLKQATKEVVEIIQETSEKKDD